MKSNPEVVSELNRVVREMEQKILAPSLPAEATILLRHQRRLLQRVITYMADPHARVIDLTN